MRLSSSNIRQKEIGSSPVALFPLRAAEGAAGTVSPLLPPGANGARRSETPASSRLEKKAARWPERIAYQMLMLFVALLYITPGVLYPELEDLPIAKGVILIAFIFFLLARRGAAPGAKSWHLTDKTTLWFVAFLAVEGLSVFDALWKEMALSAFLNALKLFAAYLLIINLVDDSKKVRKILWTLVIAALIPALGTLYHFLFKIDLQEGYRASWIGVYSDPNDLAYNMVVLVPILLALFETEKRWLLKGVLLSQLAILTAAIYATFSRGGQVGLLVVIFFQILRSHRRMLHFSIGALLLVTLLALAPASYWERAETIIKFRQDESAMGRVYAWRAGLAMLEDRPLFGVGVGCFVLGWPIYAPPEAGTKWRAPHNTFIQVMGENGLLGLITFLAFVATAVRGLQTFGRPAVSSRPLFQRPLFSPVGRGSGGAARRSDRFPSKKEEADYYARGLEIALWGFLACSLTLGIARSWPPYIFIGLALALRHIRSSENRSE